MFGDRAIEATVQVMLAVITLTIIVVLVSQKAQTSGVISSFTSGFANILNAATSSLGTGTGSTG